MWDVTSNGDHEGVLSAALLVVIIVTLAILAFNVVREKIMADLEEEHHKEITAVDVENFFHRKYGRRVALVVSFFIALPDRGALFVEKTLGKCFGTENVSMKRNSSLGKRRNALAGVRNRTSSEPHGVRHRRSSEPHRRDSSDASSTSSASGHVLESTGTPAVSLNVVDSFSAPKEDAEPTPAPAVDFQEVTSSWPPISASHKNTKRTPSYRPEKDDFLNDITPTMV